MTSNSTMRPSSSNRHHVDALELLAVDHRAGFEHHDPSIVAAEPALAGDVFKDDGHRAQRRQQGRLTPQRNGKFNTFGQVGFGFEQLTVEMFAAPESAWLTLLSEQTLLPVPEVVM